MDEGNYKRNRWFFGLGTIGRDMQYSMVSMYLMFYLTDILQVPTKTMWYVTGVMIFTRVFDAFNDPFMGVIVDNTRSRWGKFKPWILIGALLTAVFQVLMFTDFKLEGFAFVFVFLIIYLLWEISFTANDIAYWSMLPTLSKDQKQRESIGAIARICANIGLFTMVVGITPVSKMLGELTGSMQKGYFYLAIIVVLIMIFFQLFTLFGVKEDRSYNNKESHTSFRELTAIIGKNDQLLWTVVAMCLFMIGYMTTTSFGQYYFKYVFGDEDMYSIFALILGISQIASLAIFPAVSKHVKRAQLYLYATILVVLGYIVFFFAPNTSMLFIGIAGMLLFVGQAAIQLIMLMFIADSVEYGEWKLKKRNDSVTLSLQPFINKLGSAISTGIVGATVILSGMKGSAGPQDVTEQGLLLFKFAMLVLPMIFIMISFIVYKKKYRIDEVFYQQIIQELESRRN